MTKELQPSQQGEVAQTESTALISIIDKLAQNPDVDFNKLEKMLDMQERIMNRNAELAFNQAMSAAQADMGPVSADMQNPQTRSAYASYHAIDKKLRPIYTRHGFALSFDTEDAPEGFVRVVCYVSHKDGHTRKYKADMPSDGLGAKGNAVMTKTHAAGSAMSYGMRYLLKLIFNVAIGEDDNDGNGPVEKLSPEQIANLEAMIEETGSDMAQFVRYLGGGMCNSLNEIPASLYDKGVKALEAKRRAG